MNRGENSSGTPRPPDRIEVRARRTGRALGYLALLGLALYLLFTYGPR